MGAILCSGNAFDIDVQDIKRWEEKKRASKGAIVPKVPDYSPTPLPRQSSKKDNMVSQKRYSAQVADEEKRRRDASAAATVKAKSEIKTRAEEVLFVPHQGTRSYKELAKEFGTENKKALVRMATEAHLKDKAVQGSEGPATYSSQTARSAPERSSSSRMTRSQSMKR